MGNVKPLSLEEAAERIHSNPEDLSGTRILSVKPFNFPGDIPPRKIISIGGAKFYAKGYLSLTGAAGGTGKTALSIVEELSLVYGLDLLSPKDPITCDYRPLRCGRQRVWCMSLEDDEEEHQRRVVSAVAHYGLDPAKLVGWYFCTYANDSPVVIAEIVDRSFYVGPQKDQIMAVVKEYGIDVITADPFVATHGIPENDNGAMNRVAALWREISQRCGIAVVLTHHVRKTGGAGEVSSDDLRGAVSLVGAARIVRVLQQMSLDESKTFLIAPERRRFYFWVNPAAKANIVPPADRRHWFHLASHHLENETQEWEADSVGVVEPWNPPAALDGVTGEPCLAPRRPSDRQGRQVPRGELPRQRQAEGWIGKIVAEITSIEEKTKLTVVIKQWVKDGVLVKKKITDENRISRPCLAIGKSAIIGDPEL